MNNKFIKNFAKILLLVFALEILGIDLCSILSKNKIYAAVEVEWAEKSKQDHLEENGCIDGDFRELE